MSKILKHSITMIGSGRVAKSMSHALHSNGNRVNEIYSRRLEHAQNLARHIPKATVTDSLDFSNSQSNIFMLAINDDAIAEVSTQIKTPENSYVFHTSGTVSMKILGANNRGVFYPLQTFTKGKKVAFKEIPILIEGTNDPSLEMLKSIGSSISNQVKIVTEAERQQLHVAAVFASNFTNRMLAAAEELLDDTSLDLEILKPLVMQSIQNAFDSNPDLALTGPAKREDHQTIEKHQKILEGSPDLQAIYQTITKSITSKVSLQN